MQHTEEQKSFPQEVSREPTHCIQATLRGGFLSEGRITSPLNGPEAERIIWNSLFSLDLTSSSDRDIAQELGLEYVIVEKNETGYSDIFHSIYGDYFSQLLQTAPLVCDLVVEGEVLCLFRVPTD